MKTHEYVIYWVSLPCGVKLKSGGRSRPFGSFVLGSRSSSKKQCAQDSTGISLVDGVYSSNLLHRLIASGGVLGLNTCN